mmetsp:Transcript_130542/g.417784  ORF Transcript_130542/g.417784 Transcript_130542/m.417784 type:complete len:266 (-) Transcript_130542:1270-2067(-)
MAFDHALIMILTFKLEPRQLLGATGSCVHRPGSSCSMYLTRLNFTPNLVVRLYVAVDQIPPLQIWLARKDLGMHAVTDTDRDGARPAPPSRLQLDVGYDDRAWWGMVRNRLRKISCHDAGQPASAPRLQLPCVAVRRRIRVLLGAQASDPHALSLWRILHCARRTSQSRHRNSHLKHVAHKHGHEHVHIAWAQRSDHGILDMPSRLSDVSHQCDLPEDAHREVFGSLPSICPRHDLCQAFRRQKKVWGIRAPTCLELEHSEAENI